MISKKSWVQTFIGTNISQKKREMVEYPLKSKKKKKLLKCWEIKTTLQMYYILDWRRGSVLVGQTLFFSRENKRILLMLCQRTGIRIIKIRWSMVRVKIYWYIQWSKNQYRQVAIWVPNQLLTIYEHEL